MMIQNLKGTQNSEMIFKLCGIKQKLGTRIKWLSLWHKETQ